MLVKEAVFFFIITLALVPILCALPFQLNPEERSSSEISNSENSTCDISCLASFVAAFTKAVYASEILPDISSFFKESTHFRFKKSLYDYIYEAAMSPDMAFLLKVANIISQSTEKYFDFLASPTKMKEFANAVAKYLQSEDFLDPTNAVSLGLAIAYILEEIVRNKLIESDIESKLKLLEDGFEIFLASLNSTMTDK